MDLGMNREAKTPPAPAGAWPAQDAARGDGDAMLHPDEYALFAGVGQRRPVAKGEPLFRRGDGGATMYVIEHGTIALDFGDDLVGKWLGPMEFFGELGLLIGQHARSADAVAATDGMLVELEQAAFQSLVARDPTLVARFLHRAILRVVQNEQTLIRRLRRRNNDLEAALDSLRVTTRQLSQTEELTRTDELTGLCNRRGFMLQLDQRRIAGTLDDHALLLLDCDRFKAVNDDYGHLAGDRVLQSVANILQSVAGPQDVACRLGGDEFCLLVRVSSRADLLRVADFVASTARSLHQTHASPPLVCTLSIGVCGVDANAHWNDWYALADEALYRAKRLGGDRIEWHDATPVGG